MVRVPSPQKLINRGIRNFGRSILKGAKNLFRAGTKLAKKHGREVGSLVGTLVPSVGTAKGEMIGSAVQKLANTFG